MAVLCEHIGLLFIQTPRTGSTAIARVLRKQLDGRDFPQSSALSIKSYVDLSHITVAQLVAHGVLSRSDVASLHVAAGVRNPFDSLVSEYVKKRGRYQAYIKDPDSWIHRKPGYRASMDRATRQPFERWLLRRLRADVLRRAVGKTVLSSSLRWAADADSIIRFESLQEDFDALLARLGVPERIEVPRVNVTEGRSRDYRAYYTWWGRLLLEFTHAREISRFGYSF